ncbi:sodium:solute symporter family protein [Pyrodictium abyssi]|uniref:Sodium:solute symporter n=1 Tax=Pyrodictium abyssi TaxID=54256 RepID=A0ABM8ISX9_9CREN|nr:sodium:solute symporter [Pyrodictium abyssi]
MISESVIAAYLAASLALGAAFKSKADTIQGFLVANREIGNWLLAFTFGATYFSSVVIVVGGAWAYMWGQASLIIPVFNVVLGALATFILFGQRINQLSKIHDALTVPELFGKIYSSRGLQRLLGLMTAIGLTLYAATVISGAAAMVGTVFHIDLALAAFIIAALMAIYVALGGMYSVVWTDTLQGLMMASGVAALLAISLGRVGGMTALEAAKPALPPERINMRLIFDLALLTSVAVWGLPQLVNRFYTARGPGVVRRATGIATLFAFIVTYSSFLSGLAAAELLRSNPPADPLKAIPTLASMVLGPIGAAVFSGAVLAAAMSTADSIALTTGSAVVYDVLGIRSTRALRAASFLAMIAAAVIAVATLSLPKELAHAVTTIFKTGWTLTAGAFLAPVVATVLGARSREAVVASAVAGASTALAYGVAKAARVVLPLADMSFAITVLVSFTVYAVAYLATRRR